MCRLISVTHELFKEDAGAEFKPWIVIAPELPAWEKSLLPVRVETRCLARGHSEFPEGLQFCCF